MLQAMVSWTSGPSDDSKNGVSEQYPNVVVQAHTSANFYISGGSSSSPNSSSGDEDSGEGSNCDYNAKGNAKRNDFNANAIRTTSTTHSMANAGSMVREKRIAVRF
jgi:hypothetical protein